MGASDTKCRLLRAITLVLAALLVRAAAGASPLVRPAAPAAHLAETGPPQWRSLRLRWRTPVSLNEHPDGRVRDLLLSDGRLFYVGENEVGCISAETGQPVWQRSLLVPGDAGDPLDDRHGRQLTVAEGKVFLTEAPGHSPAPPPPYLVLAFDAATGRPLWKREQHQRLSERPVAAAGMLLVPGHEGSMLALRMADGTVAWQKRWMPPPGGGSTPALHARAEGSVGVALLGKWALVGFRINDGKELWRVGAKRPPGSSSDSDGFTLAQGVAYAELSGSELAAVELATGKRRWARRAVGDSLSVPEPLGTRVLVQVEQTLTSLDRQTGATKWFQRSNDYRSALPGGGLGADPLLFLKIDTKPCHLDRPETPLSVPRLDTLVALDPTTGRERWRWQPDEGTRLRQIFRDGDRLLITDGSELFCYEPGAVAPLPTDPTARRRLAQETADFLFGRKPAHPSADGRRHFSLSASEENEGRLRLLQLGVDAVPALLGEARLQLKLSERKIPTPPELQRWQETLDRRSPGTVLDLLADVGEAESAAELARLARRLQNPFSRDQLAEALIRFGDPYVAPFLFDYARSEEADLRLRRAALHAACRAGNVPGLAQAEVTAYLRDQLTREPRINWLQQYARFELLNNRGEAARNDVLSRQGARSLSSLEPTGERWAPLTFSRAGAARDGQGTWWAAGTWDYLGNERQRLWIAQSRDGVEWTRPAYVQKLPPGLDRVDKIAARYREGKLVFVLQGLSWQPQGGVPVRREVTVSPADVYRDGDGDGLPDRLERLIGTDPEKADTNENGIADGIDKNPRYRPHLLTDEEGIYQAAVEGLGRLGRNARPDFPDTGSLGAVPFVLGRNPAPLLLPLPPGSTGIEILEHPGPVLYTGLSYRMRDLTQAALLAPAYFEPPRLGLDGVRFSSENWSPGEAPARDPFQPFLDLEAVPKLSFREFFPYERSADGTRARVGWVETGLAGGVRGFDVEVRKIEGCWYPVECRQVYSIYSARFTELPVPVRPLPDAPNSAKGTGAPASNSRVTGVE